MKEISPAQCYATLNDRLIKGENALNFSILIIPLSYAKFIMA